MFSSHHYGETVFALSIKKLDCDICEQRKEHLKVDQSLICNSLKIFNFMEDAEENYSASVDVIVQDECSDNTLSRNFG